MRDNEFEKEYNEILEKYKDLIGVDNFSSVYKSWDNFVSDLTRLNSLSRKISKIFPFPEVIIGEDGKEYQINVEHVEDRIAFDNSTEKTIADEVFRQLSIERQKQYWNGEDSYEEFTDLDEEEDSLSDFEEAYINMERDMQKDFYDFIKKKEAEIRRDERKKASENDIEPPNEASKEEGKPLSDTE